MSVIETKREGKKACDLTDAGFYEMVVDFVVGVLGASGLDNVDILSTNSLLDLAPALADGELGQDAVASGDAEYVADVVDKLGVGVAPQDDKIPDHLGRP